MRLLRLAIENQRWDLAAHTIILAAANELKKGGKPDDGRSDEKRKEKQGRCPKR